MLYKNNQGSSDQKIYSYLPNIGLSKTSDPQGGAIFGPRVIILTNLVEVTRWYFIPNIKALGFVVSEK